MYVSLLLICGVVLLSQQPCTSEKQPHRKVLILGAGLSGIVAGKTLQDNGIDDFLILEGQDYIGGRIKLEEIAGYKVEKGGNWIHFAKDKESAPIWQKKEKNKIQGFFSNYSSLIIRDKNGKDITDLDAYNRITKVFGQVEAAQKERNAANKGPISAREFLSSLGWNPKTPQEYALEYLEIDFENSKPAENISFNALFEKDPTGDFFMTDKRGTWGLFADMYTSFLDKIKLQKTVSGINYTSSKIEVKTRDGEVYTADHVLCTFSTGVLGSSMVTFNPPLPDWKKEAIATMPMVVYAKIFVKFPKKFWDDKEYILYAGATRAKYAIIQDLQRPGIYPDNSGLMLVTMTGDTGRRIEKQSYNETKTEIYEMLKGVYGPNISQPTDVYYGRWSLNQYTRGSYSEGTIKMNSDTFEKLTKNIGSQLYFSGEATSEDWYGYMQGAYLTGEAKAKEIIKAVKGNGAQLRLHNSLVGMITTILIVVLI